jgi:hypothetical protein
VRLEVSPGNTHSQLPLLRTQALHQPLGGREFTILGLLPLLSAHFLGIERSDLVAPGPSQRCRHYEVRILGRAFGPLLP